MENIEVAIRIRPANFSELSAGDLEIWDALSQETIGISAEKLTELLRFRKIVPGQKTSFNFSNENAISHSFPVFPRHLLQPSVHEPANLRENREKDRAFESAGHKR